MITERIRRCNSQEEYERVIDDYITSGYKIKSRGEKNCSMVKKGEHDKHGLVAALTVWWTFGLGNLVYALMSTKVEDAVLVKLEEKN